MATSKRRVAWEVRILAKHERGKVATEREHLLPGVACGGRAASLQTVERSANGDSPRAAAGRLRQ